MIKHVIAIRNLLKNRYRTFISLAMIAGALVAVTIFRGYVLKTLEVVQTTIVNGQFGHIQVAKKEYWNQTYKNKKETMISNSPELIDQIRTIPNVAVVSPRMKFYALLSTEQVSDSAMIIGMDYKEEQNFSVGLMIIDGPGFEVGDKKIMIGSSLAKRLKVKAGDDVTIVTTTLDQVVNAMDLKVSGIFATGAEEFDSVAAFMDINDTRKVMNSQSIEVLKISLKDIKSMAATESLVKARMNPSGLETKNWYEISDLFRKVESFYNTQTGLMFSILVFIVLLGVTNTVSMSLNERIGEIGTLRALGQSRRSLLGQFMLESFYLCTVALVLGALVAYGFTEMVNAANIRTEIPGASIPLQVQIGFYWDVVIFFGVALFLVVNVFTAVLVSKFIRIKIVEALRHNI